jgi:hypothetical protein
VGTNEPEARNAPALTAGAPDVDALFEGLRKIYCAAGTLVMVSVGRLVLERIYGGDVELWRSRARSVDSSHVSA